MGASDLFHDDARLPGGGELDDDDRELDQEPDEQELELEEGPEFEEELEPVEEDLELVEEDLELVEEEEFVEELDLGEEEAAEGEDLAAAKVARARRAEEGEDEEDLLEPEDVEADLDTLLRERIAAEELEGEEEEGELGAVPADVAPEAWLSPRRQTEFVCRSCFLIKNVTQRAGPGDICRDCA